ncbi:phosphatidate cytidylyltransferase [Caminicella sporogenes DSM 14501]|uniref:Phosphatidate cytidylyltransferase n=1 Tax=Caminicella sporogenes DSM 14501 TaxID=1121266 RepID=A0A1M6L9A2_9FIRM|nr:phosphatidate cytidylyltransferase [Caminicella sporogenes]RKD27750.1 phosphatidate cytidylyltransferase [Caminicella sporogenes]SHJ67734.1 phosphatidate cytidylyltransferase [Caminicella sporogenes DSM 14501]
MTKRILSGIIGLPLLIYIILSGGITLIFAVLFIALMGLSEFYKSFFQKNIYPITFIGYFFTAQLFADYYFYRQKYFLCIIFLITFILLIIFLFSKKYSPLDVSITLLGFLYVSVFLLHIIYISDMNVKNFIWFPFITAWATDTFAYFTGYFFGRKKLIPQVSPKKTVEGSIGGIIGSIIVSLVFSYIFMPKFILHSVVIGLIGSIFSQIGDLIASKIKRYVGIKDFGNIIPGHGGVLDRFDSIILTAPIIYYYLIFFTN